VKILPLVLLPILAQAWEMRIPLPNRTFDARDPAKGDFLDCPSSTGPCQAVIVSRVEPDEKVALPRNKARESLSWLTFKGFRAQGGDPVTSAALFKTASGESLFVDWNNDEDLGNDGPARWWPTKDSCVTADGGAGRSAPVTLCRAGAKAKDYAARCEGLKSSITWAACEEGPYRVRLLDMVYGVLTAGPKPRKVGLADLDGDGRFRLNGGDRLLIDWNGDGILEKSLDGDGFAQPQDGPLAFSVDRTTYEVVSADEDGSGLTLDKLDEYRSGAEVFKAAEGRPAPDFRFVNMDGDTVKLSDFRGQKVLLQFWSTLCKACIDQLPAVKAFHGQFKGKNWQVISVTTDKELDMVQQATLKHHMEWMVGMAGPEVRGYYGSHPLPLVLKIDPKGIIEKKGMPLGNRTF
jgi:thiol-disulfide isomerase/thioredoxin